MQDTALILTSDDTMKIEHEPFEFHGALLSQPARVLRRNRDRSTDANSRSGRARILAMR